MKHGRVEKDSWRGQICPILTITLHVEIFKGIATYAYGGGSRGTFSLPGESPEYWLDVDEDCEHM